MELAVAARPFCEALMNEGLLCKETHDRVVRFAPPLVTTREDLEWAVGKIRKASPRWIEIIGRPAGAREESIGRPLLWANWLLDLGRLGPNDLPLPTTSFINIGVPVPR